MACVFDRCSLAPHIDANVRAFDVIPDSIDLDTSDISLHKIRNGANLLLLRTPANKLCFLQIVVKVGSLNENMDQLEMAHLLEHLNGRFTSEKHPCGSINMQRISDNGGSLNASVSDYLSEFHIRRS